MSSLVTLSLSQLIIVSVASFSIEAFDLIFLEYFKDQKPIAINPTNKRPRTTFTSMKLELPFVTNFNIPMSLRIRIIIPAAPHTKKVIADDKLSLYLSSVDSYRLPECCKSSMPSSSSIIFLASFSEMPDCLASSMMCSSTVLSDCEFKLLTIISFLCI